MTEKANKGNYIAKLAGQTTPPPFFSPSKNCMTKNESQVSGLAVKSGRPKNSSSNATKQPDDACQLVT